MTSRSEIWNNQALTFANYFAIRTITLAVVAFVGLFLAGAAIAAIAVFVISENPFLYPAWVEPVIGFFAIGGGLWFVVFLVMSLQALRRHTWFHGQLIGQ